MLCVMCFFAAGRRGRPESRVCGGVKRAVAPSARALGARHPRRAAASGGKSLSSPSSLPPTLTSKLTSHHDHTARACTKRGKYTPPPGPTPGAYLAGRHKLNCRYLWRPGGRIASGRKTLARHFELESPQPSSRWFAKRQFGIHPCAWCIAPQQEAATHRAAHLHPWCIAPQPGAATHRGSTPYIDGPRPPVQDCVN